MSLVWNEQDEKGINAVKQLRESGRCLLISDKEDIYKLEFKVKDIDKANNFIMDIFTARVENDNSDITGIEVLSVGHSQSKDVETVKELLSEALKILD